MEPNLLVADASTLLNFLWVQRFDLIRDLGLRVGIVDAVVEEIRSERAQVDALLASGALEAISLSGDALTGTLARFLGMGLGNGESFSFAAAIENGAVVAIDDRRAIRRLQSIAPTVPIVTTVDIVVAALRTSRLTWDDAQSLRSDWETKHRFRLPADALLSGLNSGD